MLTKLIVSLNNEPNKCSPIHKYQQNINRVLLFSILCNDRDNFIKLFCIRYSIVSTSQIDYYAGINRVTKTKTQVSN